MMDWIINSLSLILLMSIFIQDWKDRAVYWWLFPPLLMIGGYQFYQTSYPIADAFASLYFLLMILVLLIGYVSFKRKKWVNIFKTDFGLGDVLFLIAIIPFFSHNAYIVFFISGMFLSLIVHRFVMMRKKSTVPLAGYLALYVALIKVIEIFTYPITYSQF